MALRKPTCSGRRPTWLPPRRRRCNARPAMPRTAGWTGVRWVMTVTRSSRAARAVRGYRPCGHKCPKERIMNKLDSNFRSAVLAGLGAFGLAMTQLAGANGMHPEVPLLDTNGNPVIESGLPLSTMQTCGGDCHDTSYIMHGSDHADAGASRLGQ